MGSLFLLSRFLLGPSKNCQGCSHQLEGFFCWKKEKKDLEIYSSLHFRDGTVDVQKLKHSFVSNLWSWNSLYIGEEISSLIGFLEWLASH